jgi:tagatose 1,6-diphosphate aldolase
MSIRLTPGKMAGLKAISDRRGVIAALALDQRGIIRSGIAKAMGKEDVDPSVVMEFKELVTDGLTPYASAILLDVEYGLPATKRRHNAGLMLAYEVSVIGGPPPRLPKLYDNWSIRRQKEAGADGIKVLLNYTPFDPPEINDIKNAWLERIGDECRANDIPFILELLGYGVQEGGTKLAYAKQKPEMVIRSIEEYTKDRYGVDLLKLEVPIDMHFTSGTSAFKGEQAYTLDEAKGYLAAASAATDKPIVYLSAGVTNAEFIQTLELVAESGGRYNGVLCGRATWFHGMEAFAKGGAKALNEWLQTEGRENIERINKAVAKAEPWTNQLEPAVAR